MSSLANKPHVMCVTPAKGKAVARYLFAHGAGAGMDSDFMADMADKLSALGIEVVRFNFAYMQTMSETGKRRPPDRMPKLQLAWQAMIDEVIALDDGLPLFIGGKSMGGRASTIVAAELGDDAAFKGVVVMGYPFHATGKPEKVRTEHLPDIKRSVLVLQGERDAMGNKQAIAGYELPDIVKVEYLPDGDHSLKPRKASGHTLEENLSKAAEEAATFIKGNL